jgi:hypothetical protein
MLFIFHVFKVLNHHEEVILVPDTPEKKYSQDINGYQHVLITRYTRIRRVYCTSRRMDEYQERERRRLMRFRTSR